MNTEIIVALILVVILTTAILFTIFLLNPSVTVLGVSMYPTYRDGELIYGTRLFRRDNIRVGDVVVLRHPYDSKYYLIKRVAHVYGSGKNKRIWVLGDNLENSRDSRDFGTVSVKLVIAKIRNPRKLR